MVRSQTSFKTALSFKITRRAQTRRPLTGHAIFSLHNSMICHRMLCIPYCPRQKDGEDLGDEAEIVFIILSTLSKWTAKALLPQILLDCSPLLIIKSRKL